MESSPSSASKAAGPLESIRRLYACADFRTQSWKDDTDHAFISTSLIERSIAALAPQLRGRLIDVGCGQQPYRRYFTHAAAITACDYDKNRGDVDFACPAEQVPVPDGSFDSILCTEVLEHVPDPLKACKEFYRILTPGGKLLLTTPMYWPAHEEPHDYYRYPGCGLEFILRSAGFEVEELLPRGGTWAFFGQVIIHVLSHYLRRPWMRRFVNRTALRIDAARCNPQLTLGWTALASKPLT